MRLLAVTAAAIHIATAAGAAEIRGSVTRIVDGDTFDLAGATIRVCGIDAPERNEPGYAAARDALASIVSGRQVRCLQVSIGLGTVCDGRSRPTNHGRIVAQCFVGEDDVADLLIRLGVVCDWVRFSGGHYSRNGGSRC